MHAGVWHCARSSFRPPTTVLLDNGGAGGSTYAPVEVWNATKSRGHGVGTPHEDLPLDHYTPGRVSYTLPAHAATPPSSHAPPTLACGNYRCIPLVFDPEDGTIVTFRFVMYAEGLPYMDSFSTPSFFFSRSKKKSSIPSATQKTVDFNLHLMMLHGCPLLSIYPETAPTQSCGQFALLTHTLASQLSEFRVLGQLRRVVPVVILL